MLPRIWAFLFSSLVAVQAMQSPPLREMVQAAQQAEKQGDMPRAIQIYGEMLRIKPHSVAAEFHLALAYDSQQRFSEAIALLTEIIRHDPEMADAYLLRGKDYYEINQYQNAIQSLQRARELEPKNEQVHFYLGATYYQLKEYGRAALAYLQQIRIQPQESDLYFQLLQSYQALENNALQRINQNQQGRYFALLLEAEKNINHQDLITAESQLRPAIAIFPEAPEAWLLLRQINTKRGEEEEAKANLNKVVQLEAKGLPSFRGLATWEIAPKAGCLPISTLATAYCKATHDELGMATKLAQEAAASGANDPRTLYWLAQIYSRLTQKTTARLARIAPDSSGLHKLYARTFDENGRRAEAESEYEKAVGADYQDASTFVEYANFRVKNQEFPQAIGLLERALQLTPYDFNVHLLLAQAHIHNSQPDSAVPYFREVLKANPENIQLRIDLAECLYSLDQALEAVKVLEEAPVDPDGRIAYVLAKYYARQGEKEKAFAALEVFRQRQKQIAK